MYFDPLYIILILPVFLLSILCQIFVKLAYSRYSKVANSNNVTGVDVVEAAVKNYNIDLRLETTYVSLADSYNPTNKVITLSEQVARSPSVASVGIAAHEVGHAIQHQNGFFLSSIRNFIIPLVNIGTTISYFLFILGFSLQIFGLILLGIIAFSMSTLFTFITLPIEIDASVRAVNMIKRLQILDENEVGGVKTVLTAAALTYVAALVQSLMTLLYYIMRAFGRRE